MNAIAAKPIRIETAKRDRPTQDLLLLSANCRQSLGALASRYSAVLAGLAGDGGADSVTDVIAAAACRREHLPHRLVVAGRSPQEFATRLAGFAADPDASDPHVVAGMAVARGAKVALVFSGNGAQWDGMGRIAFETSASFRRHFRAVDHHYQERTGSSLETLLFAEDLGEQLQRTELAQPLQFAIQVALARALEDQGLAISTVLGHSVGEVAAAHVAGALDLAQAVAVIRARSKHQELAAGKGLMAAVQASPDAVREVLASCDLPAIEIAAHNSPRAVTVSGSSDDIRAFARHAEDARLAVRVLDINYPFHSSGLDAVREPLLADLADLEPTPATRTMVSSVSGAPIEGRELTADYWWNNVRRPVRFDTAVAAAAKAGCQIFIEIGPRPILRKYITDSIADTDLETAVLSSLAIADTAERPPVRAILARALVAGAAHNAEIVFGRDAGRRLDLPTYAWQNRQFVFARSSEALDTFDSAAQPHPLLGFQLRAGENVWDSHLDTGLVAYLADHCVAGKPIMPGTGFVEMALNAAAANLGTRALELRDLDFAQALELDGDACQAVRTRVDRESGSIEVSSRRRLTDDEHQPHARTRYACLPSSDIPALEPPRLATAPDAPVRGEIYRLAEKFGLDYGPAFQRVTACREIGGDIIEVELTPATEQPGSGAGPYILHPVDFDACFHGLNVVFERLVFGENKLAYVPIHIGRLRVFAPGLRVRCARIHLVSYNTRAVRAGFELYAADGQLIAIADNVRFRASNLVHRVSLA